MTRGPADPEGLVALEARVTRELEVLAYPRHPWVPHTRTDTGERALDVLVVGAGQGGLAVAFALSRERVTHVRIVDAAPRGDEGPWRGYARMLTLRSPKEVTGPDLGVPALAFQSWFEAQHGEAAWDALGKIPTGLWADYLDWYRRVLALPVENDTRLGAVRPRGSLVEAELVGPDGAERVLCRKLVLATGIEAAGRWWAPPELEGLAPGLWAHTADSIGFEALAGRRVAVLGAGASALDNAASALEHGAQVDLFVRRPELQRVQPFKWLSFPGFLRHFSALDDTLRWRFMNHLMTLREAFPAQTWERVNRHAGFRLHTGAPWLGVETVGEGANATIRIRTPAGVHRADFAIAGTGLEIDLALRPELAAVAEHAATWSDRYRPEPGEENPRLGRYPYLGPHMELLEREPGTAPWLGAVHLFNFGATMSMGPSGSSINAMKFAVPRLVDGIVRDLFVADAERHLASLIAYDKPEFLLPGEAGAPAPTTPVIERDLARE